MSDHMQAAVEAGAKEVWRWYVGSNLDGLNERVYTYNRLKATEAAQAVIEAALPHLRQMIAEEIEKSASGAFGLVGPVARQDIEYGVHFSARIARGEQP